MEINEYINGEREFLHGMATPLMIASGQIEYMLELLKRHETEGLPERLQKALDALNKVSDQLNERRQFVKTHVVTE